MGNLSRCICDQPARFGVSWLQPGEKFKWETELPEAVKQQLKGSQSQLRGVVWEWQPVYEPQQSEDAGPKIGYLQCSQPGFSDMLEQKSNLHAKLEQFRYETSPVARAMESPVLAEQKHGSTTEGPSVQMLEKKEGPRGPRAAMPNRQLGQPETLKGGAPRESLMGGSGADVAQIWQETAQNISAMLAQASQAIVQQPAPNVERHTLVGLHNTEAWQCIATVAREAQAELTQFANHRIREEDDGAPNEPPAKRPRQLNFNPEAQSEFRLALCSMLDELRELQEDVLSTLRDRSMLNTWSQSQGLSRALTILHARLRGTEIFQAFRLPEATCEAHPNTRHAVPDLHVAPQSEVRKHLLRQVLCNNGNLCYVNSVLRTWVWTLDGLERLPMVGRLLQLHDLLAFGPTKLRLTDCAAFKSLVTDWDALHDQQDAGDFLGHVLSTAQATEFTCVSLSIFEHDPVGWNPIFLPFPAQDGPTNVQVLINQWSNQHAVITKAEEVLVFRLGRYVQTASGWIKHQGAIIWDETILVPTGWDIEAETPYEVTAVVCHHGKAIEQGHYTAYCLQEGTMWHLDDDRAAQRALNVTAEEIYMMWLRKKLLPVTEIHREPQPMDTEQEQHPWISSANITQWSTAFVEWLYHSPVELLLIQEHHLEENAVEQAGLQAVRKGWQPLLMAAAQSKKGGTHGGVGILFREHMSVHHHQQFMKEGCGWIAAVLTEADQQILVISIYLKHSVGIQEDTNAAIVGALMACVQQWQGPWIVAGDWNLEPSELIQSEMPSLLKGEVVAPDSASTNTGSLLDFSMASRDLSPHLHLQVEWECPWKPHGLIQLRRQTEGLRQVYPQLEVFPALPKPLEEFQTPWEDFQPVDHSDFLQAPLNSMGQFVARWASISEQFLLQNLPEGREGRGRHIETQMKPLKVHAKTGKWRRAHWMFWQRFVDLLQQRNVSNWQRWQSRVIGLMADCGQHWQHSDETSMTFFLDNMHHWVHQMEPVDAPNLVQIAEAQRTLAQTEAMQAEQLHYKEWIQSGLAKGCKGIFAAIRSPEAQWQRPFRHIALQERPEARRQYWGDIWGDLEAPLEIPEFAALQAEAKNQVATWEPLEVERVMKCFRRLSPKASGLDGISIDMLRNAPEAAVSSLIDIFHHMERHMELPTQCQTALIALLPKNTTAERPIALLSVIYRVWVRLRWPPLQKWQQHAKLIMPWEAAMPGVRVADVALNRMMKAEVTQLRGLHAAQMLLDLSSFYDRARLSTLAKHGKDLQYPLPHLLLALQAYTGPRYLQGEGIVSKRLFPSNGILPGCPQAPLLAKVVLWPVLAKIASAFPDVELEVWIDDIGFTIIGSDPKLVAHRLMQAYRMIEDELTKEGLLLSAGKSGILVTDKTIEKAVNAVRLSNDPKIFRVLKDLGLDATAGRCRRIATIRKRCKKGKARYTRLLRLRVGNRACKI